jgi:hypothetical protein
MQIVTFHLLRIWNRNPGPIPQLPSKRSALQAHIHWTMKVTGPFERDAVLLRGQQSSIQEVIAVESQLVR